LENQRILILTVKSVGLIKWRKVELENLFINPFFKRRIRERATRNYPRGERQNPHWPFNFAPTYLYRRVVPKLDDYGKKWLQGRQNHLWLCLLRALGMHKSFGGKSIGEGKIGKSPTWFFFCLWEILASTRRSALDSLESASPLNYLARRLGRAASTLPQIY
jgi:hypothetical protein